mgnify:CR=1 FL=1
MRHEEAVRDAHVAGMDRVDADHLAHADGQEEGDAEVLVREPGELRRLLFGDPITRRRTSALVENLDDCLRAVLVLLEHEVGQTDGLEQTKLEWGRVIAMGSGYRELCCKRAALLYALHREPSIAAHFALTDPELVADLQDRVLPLTIPNFVQTMSQTPDALVLLVGCLASMWPGECMGVGTHAESR